MKVADKVAIVTGAGSGIGQAAAELLAEEGAKVLVADFDPKGGKETVEAIKKKGHVAHFIEADISKEEDAKRISEEAVKAFGGINILVNDAATFVLKGFDATMDDWRHSVGVNIIGTAMVTKYAVEHLKKQGGAIVNLSSMSAFVAQPNFTAYSCTKAAIAQMTRNMAMDLAPFKVRVNSICPGPIITAASYRHMEKVGQTFEEFDAIEGEKTLLKRTGRPREVAYAILFFASEESSYITGSCLLVDGGYTAQ